MKLAIQGHPTRGKEVIQILESLGGRNVFNYNGDFIRTAYFIGMDYSIYGFCTDSPKVGFKVYTLEEFEKEFPFKIGDKVIWPVKVGWWSGIIVDLNPDYYKIIDDKCNYHFVKASILQLYPMKEERNITLTLDKAKEWYKKGGELREIALQAFTEKELTKINLPKTWEEFCKNYPVQEGECWLSDGDEIMQHSYSIDRLCKNWIPSKKSAEAHLAMIQLEQLRDCWRQGWVQTPTNTGYRIDKKLNGEYVVLSVVSFKYFLAFPTKEMAEEFLKCFRDLIEKAGDLI